MGAPREGREESKEGGAWLPRQTLLHEDAGETVLDTPVDLGVPKLG
jgi:hypothetical protein